jgi:hypothetical protein
LHEQIDTFEADYRRGDLDAVVSYYSMVLEASVYPDGFPQRFRFAYVSESRQAVAEYELPTVDVIPPVKSYRYVKQSDSITESARPQAQIKSLYASVVAQARSGRCMSCSSRIRPTTSTRWCSTGWWIPPTQEVAPSSSTSCLLCWERIWEQNVVKSVRTSATW